jgi:phosphatidylglycerophosphatase A
MTTNAQLATAFGIGRVPYAPGTAASFAALIIAIPVIYFIGWFAMFALALATAAAGIWVSEAYAVEAGQSDPSDCVIDEFAGQWLACALAALGAYLNGEALSATGYLLAFAVFRLFDVAKPWPVSRAESLKGGFGIMADDVVAGAIAGLFVFLIEQSGFL